MLIYGKRHDYHEIKYYPGTIGEVATGVKVRLSYKSSKIVSKTFNFSKFSSKDDALLAAEVFLQENSDELELTVTQRVKNITVEQKQFFAGAFDGDGCILFSNKLQAQVAQSSSDENPPALLTEFRDCFGGNVTGPYTRNRVGKYGSHKPEYRFCVTGKQCKPLLEVIAQYGIIKAPQAIMGLECLSRGLNRSINPILLLSVKDKTYYKKMFTKAKTEYDSVPIDKSKITDAWMAGFFEAEGTIGYHGTEVEYAHCLYLSFTQHGCLRLLDEINEQIGNVGAINHGQLTIRRQQDVLSVVSRIEKFLLGKKEQIVDAKAHLKVIGQRKRKRRTEEEIAYDMDASKKCAALKRYKVDTPIAPSIVLGKFQLVD